MQVANKKIGYFCSMAPVEIVMAAGFKPVWVRGRANMTAAADAYLYPNICPYIKSLFTDALEDGGTALDGLVFISQCDGMRRLHDVWKAYIPSKFIYMLQVSKNVDRLAVEYFATQLRDFALQMEKVSGSEINGPALKQAIKSANRTRGGMRDLYSLQTSSPLPVSGSELFDYGLQILCGEDNEAADRISSIRKKASKSVKHGKGKSKTRIMISGNVMDRLDLFKMIEDAGAEVPVADFYTASRYFERTVDENENDPFIALAAAYLGAPRCSRTASPGELYDRISSNVKQYAVDGVVLTALKFCDQQLYDIPGLLKRMETDSIPVLFLENDYVFSDRDRVRTRVQAFVEMLER